MQTNLIMAVLDPEQKSAHFVKYWGAELSKEVLDAAETIVRDYCDCLRRSTDTDCFVLVQGSVQETLWQWCCSGAI